MLGVEWLNRKYYFGIEGMKNITERAVNWVFYIIIAYFIMYNSITGGVHEFIYFKF